MKPVEYAPTAWDSTKPRDLPPLDEKRLGTVQRAVRRHPLRGRGVQCREFLTGSFARQAVEQLQQMSEEDRTRIIEKDIANGDAMKINWTSLKNPVAVLDVISRVAIFFAIAGGGAFCWFYYLVVFSQ